MRLTAALGYGKYKNVFSFLFTVIACMQKALPYHIIKSKIRRELRISLQYLHKILGPLFLFSQTNEKTKNSLPTSVEIWNKGQSLLSHGEKVS